MSPVTTFSRIIRHDWRALRADGAAPLVALIVVVAVGYGIWNGVRWVRFQQRALAAVALEEQERYAALHTHIAELNAAGGQISPFADPRNPSTFASRRGVRHATLPPAPLAPFAIGQSDLLPYYLQVTTESREALVAATEIENPYRLLVGRFDLAFVVIYLFPLVILGFSYNLLSAEREGGTLAMVLSQPVSTGVLVAGKVALRVVGLVGLVVATGAIGVVLAGLGTSAGLPLLLWTAAVALYGAFWFALAVLVVSLDRPSAASATILASVWLVLVVLVPALLSLLVNTLVPVPSRVQMVQAVREAADQANAKGSALLAQYFEAHPELAGADTTTAANDFAAVRLAVNDAVEREVRPIVHTFDRQRSRQQQVVGYGRLLSPAILMQDVLNDVSGTGPARHRHFLTQVETYHDTWRAHFTPLILQRARVTSTDGVPTFAYVEESARAVLGRVTVSLSGLAAATAVLAGLAMRRLRRYPIVTT